MPDEPHKSWLDDKLTAFDALYQKFGRDGLRGQSLGDVQLFLCSKELAYRDAPKGRDLSEEQKAANRKLELEVKDLAGYMSTQLAGAGIGGSRMAKLFSPSHGGQQMLKQRDREQER